MSSKKIHKLFPTPIFESKVNNYEKLNQDLEKYIYNLRDKDKDGLKLSNAGGGWHSPYFEIAKSIEVKNFLNAISPTLLEIITKDFGWKCTPQQIRFEGMWSVINRKNSYNLRHFHPNCHLSAAYYVKAKKDCGKIKFFDPLDQRIMKSPSKTKQTELSAEALSFTPDEGDLLIFPAYLHHSVEENLSNEDRIVISFNVDIQK